MYELLRRRQRHRLQEESGRRFSFLPMPAPWEYETFGPVSRFFDCGQRPGTGAESGPFHQKEVITIVLDGRLTLVSAPGEEILLERNDVCLSRPESDEMLLYRSEGEIEARYLEIWFDNRELEGPTAPRKKPFRLKSRPSFVLPLASGQEHEGALPLEQDTALYWVRLNEGENFIYDTVVSRNLMLAVIQGGIRLPEDRLLEGDSVRVLQESKVEMTALKTCSVVMIDLPGTAEQVDGSAV